MGVTSECAAGVADPPAPRRSRPWLRVVVVVAALLFLSLLAYGVLSKAPDGTIDDTLAGGEPAAAPGFDLPVLQRGDPGAELDRAVDQASADGRVSLDELRGTPVVLNFWASWCDPCRAEAEALEDGWSEARDRGTMFVGLNMQDLTGDARGFMSEFDNSYLNIRDESNAVALDWGVTGLPETFFLRRRRRRGGPRHRSHFERPARAGRAGGRGGTPARLDRGRRQPQRGVSPGLEEPGRGGAAQRLLDSPVLLVLICVCVAAAGALVYAAVDGDDGDEPLAVVEEQSGPFRGGQLPRSSRGRRRRPSSTRTRAAARSAPRTWPASRTWSPSCSRTARTSAR